jgi:hypothetical protein
MQRFIYTTPGEFCGGIYRLIFADSASDELVLVEESVTDGTSIESFSWLGPLAEFNRHFREL